MLVNPQRQIIPPPECRAALEDIQHLTQKICGIWGTADLDTFLSRLIMDARDGARQGLPVEVASEIMFLARTNKMVRAIDLGKKLSVDLEEAYRRIDEDDQVRLTIDAFDDPLVSRDTVINRPQRSAAPARRPASPAAGSQAQGLGELLLMLIRSKWLAWAIAIVLGLKFVWPTVKGLL